MAVEYICENCDRSFKWRLSLKRHLGRKRPCRKPGYFCTDCNKSFVTQHTLSKHKSMYCKTRNISSLLQSNPVVISEKENTISFSELKELLYNNTKQQGGNLIETSIDTSISLSCLMDQLLEQNEGVEGGNTVYHSRMEEQPIDTLQQNVGDVYPIDQTNQIHENKEVGSSLLADDYPNDDISTIATMGSDADGGVEITKCSEYDYPPPYEVADHNDATTTISSSLLDTVFTQWRKD